MERSATFVESCCVDRGDECGERENGKRDPEDSLAEVGGSLEDGNWLWDTDWWIVVRRRDWWELVGVRWVRWVRWR